MHKSIRLSLLGFVTLLLAALNILGVIDVPWECIGGLCCGSFALPVLVIGLVTAYRFTRR